MDGLGRAKQDARAEGNAGAIAEVHRGAHDYMDVGVRAVQDATADGEGETVHGRDTGLAYGRMRRIAAK
jgi:hypothetical protein